MTQTYEAWRITYQSSEQAARAAFERMMELEQGKCLHQIAEPARTDDELRAMWRDAGGAFHGPIIETGTMPESKLLTFLRGLAQPAAQGLDVQDASVLQHLLGNAKLKKWDGGYRADFDISIDADSNGVRAKTAKEAVLNALAAQAKQRGA